MKMGPLHLMVIGFEQTTLAADIIEALQSARDEGVIRLLDFLFVAVDEDGIMSAVEVSDLLEEDGLRSGAVVSALTGVGAQPAAGTTMRPEKDFGFTDEDMAELAELIPYGNSAILAVFEHRWAADLTKALYDAGGVVVAQQLMSPRALHAIDPGLAAAREVVE